MMPVLWIKFRNLETYTPSWKIGEEPPDHMDTTKIPLIQDPESRSEPVALVFSMSSPTRSFA